MPPGQRSSAAANATGRDAEIANLRTLYDERRHRIRARLTEFHRIPPTEYVYELAYCLLTPQTSAENADRAVERLREMRFADRSVDPEPILGDRRNYIRFHRTKAKYLIELKTVLPFVQSMLASGAPPAELREWLVRNVRGLGYKEATHFLRNIGRNGGLTILDRHILRNLARFGVIRSVPISLTRRRYLAIEANFTRFANALGIPVDELDLLFWSMETGEIRK